MHIIQSDLPKNTTNFSSLLPYAGAVSRKLIPNSLVLFNSPLVPLGRENFSGVFYRRLRPNFTVPSPKQEMTIPLCPIERCSNSIITQSQRALAKGGLSNIDCNSAVGMLFSGGFFLAQQHALILCPPKTALR